MAFPDPQPALVIRYSYLWHSEFAAGREEGVKDRPCAIVAAVRVDDDGQWKVLVLPINPFSIEEAHNITMLIPR